MGYIFFKFDVLCVLDMFAELQITATC